MSPRLVRVVPALMRAAGGRIGPRSGRLPRRLLGGLVLLGAALLCGCGGTTQARAAPSGPGHGGVHGTVHDPSGPVRMRQVTLFSSGVGYFEQGGTVADGGAASLTFTSQQLDDALKSLVIEDAGGTVATIEYPSTLPLDRLLHDEPVDIAGQPSLADLLTQLRGTPVSLVWHGEALSGTVLGVETHVEAAADGAPAISHAVLTILREGQSRQLPLTELAQLHFDDPRVQDALLRALSAIRAARNDQRRTMTVRSAGPGPHLVRMGYVTAAPLWKTSYRLVLAQDDPAQAQLQGWAIVENQSDVDWQQVSLALVSGRPQSFVEHLSRPLLLQRPRVDPAIYASLRPQVYQERSITRLAAMHRSRPGNGMFGSLANAPEQSDEQLKDRQEKLLDEPMDLTRSIAVAVHSDALVDRTAFTLDGVSIPRNRSAMLPVVNQALSAENVSIFTTDAGLSHPLRGVLLTNTSALNLGQGPVAVFDHAGWLGDALIDDLPAHDHRLLGYAVDLAVTVRTEPQDQEARTTAWSVAGGRLTLSQQITETTVYQFEHGDGGHRMLIIEVPRQAGWSFTGMAAPVEQTPSHARFRLSLDGSASTTFTVRTSHVADEQIALSMLDDVQALDISTSQRLPQALVALLDEIGQARREISAQEHRQSLLESGMTVSTADQKRLRRIVHILDPEGALAQRLKARLAADETEIGRYQDALRVLRGERELQQARLGRLLATVAGAVESH